MEESRNDTQQIQETQRKIEKIEEGEKNMVSREIKRGIFQVETQEDRQKGGIRYAQTKAMQSSSIVVKSEVKVESPHPPTPPGLSYAGGDEGISGLIPRGVQAQTKLPNGGYRFNNER